MQTPQDVEAMQRVLQQEAAAVEAQWERVLGIPTKNLLDAAALMAEANEDVMAFRGFPAKHQRKIWSTNPLARLNREITLRTRLVGSSPKNAATIHLVGALLLDRQEE